MAEQITSSRGFTYVPRSPPTPTPSGGGRLMHETLVPPRNRSCNWCFTVNNYCEADQRRVEDLQYHGDVRYIIYGREVAPETGTPHLQGSMNLKGFVSFKKKKEFVFMQSVMPWGTHLEKAKGSPYAAAEYCAKEDPNPWEFVNLV